MKVAIEWKKQNDGDTTKIREVSAKFQALKEFALNHVADDEGRAFGEKSWAAAYWRAVHTGASEISTGSLVFNLFRDEILMDLQENPDTCLISTHTTFTSKNPMCGVKVNGKGKMFLFGLFNGRNLLRVRQRRGWNLVLI